MRSAAILAATLVLTACGAGDPASPAVFNVAVSAPKQTIAVGEAVQLTTVARDVNGLTLANAKFTYAATPSTVVSVSTTGRVIGIATGTAVITATAGGQTSLPLSIQVLPGNVAAVVTMQANTFTPTQTSIRVGQSVLFDFPAEQHNVMFKDRSAHPGVPADIPVPASLPAGVTRAFSTAGTFPYDCTLHPGMTGQVTVNP